MGSLTLGVVSVLNLTGLKATILIPFSISTIVIISGKKTSFADILPSADEDVSQYTDPIKRAFAGPLGRPVRKRGEPWFQMPGLYL